MTQQTPDKYRVFGNPIEHSRSPDIHHIFAVKSQQNIDYQKQLVDIDDFSNAVTAFSFIQLGTFKPFALARFNLSSKERFSGSGIIPNRTNQATTR